MTPRPTRERIEEIRKWAEKDCGSGHPVNELLLEIDALNVEVKTASEMCLNANDYAIRLLKERDALKAEMIEVTYDSGVILVNGKPVADHSEILRTIVERYPIMTLVPTDKLREMQAENEKLKGALSAKLHEDRDYCQEFTAVRILQEENQKLRERVGNLTKALELIVHVTMGIRDPGPSVVSASHRCKTIAEEALAQDTCIDSGPEAIHSGKDVSNDCVHKTVRTVSNPPDETI